MEILKWAELKRSIFRAASLLLLLSVATYFVMNSRLPFTVYVSQQPAYALQKDTGPIAWSDAFDVEIAFNAASPFAMGAGAVVDIIGRFESSVEWPASRLTTINYSFYCNGQNATTARLSFNVSGSSGGAGMPDIIIPAKYVKRGGNLLLVHADVDSVPVGTGNAHFLYRIDTVEVCVQYSFLGIFLPYTVLFGIGVLLLLGLNPRVRQNLSHILIMGRAS